jgi:hypothetical protein
MFSFPTTTYKSISNFRETIPLMSRALFYFIFRAFSLFLIYNTVHC